VKYAFVERHRNQYSIERMCKVLDISRSGYYDWRGREPSQRSKRHARLTQLIVGFFKASRYSYGSRRILKDLRDAGERVGRGTVSLLMSRAQLVPKTVKRFRVSTESRQTKALPNVLKRQFEVSEPNQCWVSDITFIPTRKGWLYLAVMIDLYSRAVVGWAMGGQMTWRLVGNALSMGLSQRRPENGLLVHSDQGSQYASADYQRQLKEAGAQGSMSRKGNCWDNAVAESFFATLKTELTHGCDYHSRAEARQSIFEYIEVFYNRYRRHSHNGQVAPLTYELQVAK